MESPIGTVVGDKYFTLEISQEEFSEQEQMFKPVHDYGIYCYVELPERSWPLATYVTIPLEQFAVPDSNITWPTAKLPIPHSTPRQFWIQIQVHKRSQISGVTSWARIRPGDKATAHLRLPATSDAEGNKVELQPISGNESNAQAGHNLHSTPGMGRKPTILKRVGKGIKSVVGDFANLLSIGTREEYPKGEYAQRRWHQERRD